MLFRVESYGNKFTTKKSLKYYFSLFVRYKSIFLTELLIRDIFITSVSISVKSNKKINSMKSHILSMNTFKVSQKCKAGYQLL